MIQILDSGIFLIILSHMHTSKLALKVFHLKMTQFSSENCGLISRRILAKNEETSPE